MVYKMINLATVEALKTRKVQLMQRGMRDSDACVKARRKQNLSSQRCFI